MTPNHFLSQFKLLLITLYIVFDLYQAIHIVILRRFIFFIHKNPSLSRIKANETDSPSGAIP